jgi:hypothetical protein
MFRKSLFLGLTIMLAAALAYLVIQGRRQQKVRQTTPHPMEIVRESTPSLTRVLAPDDLEVLEAKMELAPSDSSPDQSRRTDLTARHQLVIRNSGRTAYHDFGLKLSYFGKGNKLLETRLVPANEIVRPGQARSIGEVKVENLPAQTLKCEAKIAYADLEPAPRQP